MNDNSERNDFPPIHPDFWLLDPAVTFLNHGSFGACPGAVLERQQQLRMEMEREPVEFLVRKMPPLLDASRGALAELINADPADVVFVQNATAGVNSVLRSLSFQPGDELLVTDHDYNACRNVVRYVAERTGAVVVEARVPTPVESSRQVVDAVLARVTPRTRVAMLDHVTSPTAIVFPIEEIARELDRRGVDTLVDGAHAPGMIPLDINRIGAAYYTGNCHKWLCAPKGAAFLHVRPDRQNGIQPPIVSHGWNRSRPGYSPFQDAFDWQGTLDPTPWLCVGEAIRFMGALLDGGIAALMRRNRGLAIRARQILCRRLDVAPVCAESLLGSMAAVRLPDEMAMPYAAPATVGCNAADRLHDDLLARFGIETPVYFWPEEPQTILRVSAQAYNHAAQYEKLADVLKEMG